MTATLNVWVSKLKNPCEISDKKWYVTIYCCDGNLLKYCGKKYLVLPAKCGHLQVKLPPGKYKVSAVWNFYEINNIYYGNHFTDSVLVTLCCDSNKCIELYNPEVHRCGVIFNQAVEDTRKQMVHKAGDDTALVARINQVVDTAIQANNQFLALARETDPDIAPLFEVQNVQEFNDFVRKRVDCDEFNETN